LPPSAFTPREVREREKREVDLDDDLKVIEGSSLEFRLKSFLACTAAGEEHGVKI